MKVWAVIDENGRVNSYVEEEQYKESESREIDVDSIPEDLHNYIFKDGEFVLSIPEPTEEQKQAEINQQRSAQLQTATLLFVRSMASTFSDEQALEIPLLFEDWDWKDANGKAIEYKQGDIRTYSGDLYRCRQDHTSQETWNPADAHSLWGVILPEGEVTEWQQPQPGIFDGYTKGQRVTFEGKTYESVYDGLNVWSPSAYPDGWVVVA